MVHYTSTGPISGTFWNLYPQICLILCHSFCHHNGSSNLQYQLNIPISLLEMAYEIYLPNSKIIKNIHSRLNFSNFLWSQNHQHISEWSKMVGIYCLYINLAMKGNIRPNLSPHTTLKNCYIYYVFFSYLWSNLDPTPVKGLTMGTIHAETTL